MNKESSLRNVRSLLASGKIKSAVGCLKQNPNDESLLVLLREYFLGESNLKNAMPIIKKLASIDSAEGEVSQSILAFLAHDYEHAVVHAENALNESPQSATANNHLGRALQNLGQSGRAIKAFKKSVKQDPVYAQAWHNLGHTRRAMDLFDEAISCYKESINCLPSYQSAHFNLALTLAILQRHAEAIQYFNGLIELNPKHELAWANLGLAYHMIGNFQKAAKAFDNAILISPESSLAYCYKGILMHEMQKIDVAVESLERATELDPNEFEAWSELSNVYEKNNELDKAKACNRKALELDSLNPTALIDAARLSGRLNNHAQAKKFLDNVNVQHLPPGKATEYLFESAINLDRLGEFNLAFKRFDEANKSAKNSPRYKAINSESFEHKLKAIEEGVINNGYANKKTKINWFRKLKQKSESENKTENKGSKLCFLVGFPRSGTTLIDTILNVGDGVTSIEEKPFIENIIKLVGEEDPQFRSQINYWEESQLNKLRSSYWDALNSQLNINNVKLIVDKLPLRFLEALFVQRLFPDAKFIFMQRHPHDVVLSNFMQNYVPTPAFVHINDMDSVVNTYSRTMAIWGQIKSQLKSGQLLETKYEDLVSTPNPTMTQVCQFLGIQYDEVMLDKTKRLETRERVGTNSYAQVAQEIYLSSVERWKNYQQELAPYSVTLSPFIKKMNYKL